MSKQHDNIMISTKTATLYRIEGIPYVKHLPCGDKLHKEIQSYHEKDITEYKITSLVDELNFSINKYDREYENEKQMVSEMKALKQFLQDTLKQLQQTEE